MWRIVLASLVLALPASADVTGKDGRVVECYCTDTQGARVELGEMICLRVNGRAFMAQCQMSLNVPMWREISEGCLSSSLREPKLQFSKPGIEPGAVDAPV